MTDTEGILLVVRFFLVTILGSGIVVGIPLAIVNYRKRIADCFRRALPCGHDDDSTPAGGGASPAPLVATPAGGDGDSGFFRVPAMAKLPEGSSCEVVKVVNYES